MYLNALLVGAQKDKAWWWCALARSMGDDPFVEFEGKIYSEMQCYACALDAEPDYSRAWGNIGAEFSYKAGEDDSDDNSDTDDDVSSASYDDVQGIEYTALVALKDELGHSLEIECYLRALKHNILNSFAWFDLGRGGGGKVGSVEYGPAECLVKWLEINEVDETA